MDLKLSKSLTMLLRFLETHCVFLCIVEFGDMFIIEIAMYVYSFYANTALIKTHKCSII